MIYRKPYLDEFRDRLRIYVTQELAAGWIGKLRDAGIATRVEELPLLLQTQRGGPFEAISLITVSTGTKAQVQKVLAA